MQASQSKDPKNATPSIKDQLRQKLTQLETLRDELRVQIHLASLEAKETWNRLEPQILHAEEMAKQAATDASHAAVEEVTKKLTELKRAVGLNRAD